jgi:hypothetical protein
MAMEYSRWSIAIGVVTILLLGTGCQQAKRSAPKEAAAAPESGTTVAALPPAPEQSFPAPTIGQLKTSEMPTIPIKGLTPATAPKIRANQSNKGGVSDPFGPSSGGDNVVRVITPKLNNKVNKSTNPAGIKPIGSMPQVTFRGPGQSNYRPTATGARSNRSLPSIPSFQPAAPVRIQPIAVPPMSVPKATPQAVAAPVAIAAPAPVAPQPPATALADAVEITGVMGQTLIIKAPNETSARYVQAGARIAGGKVYVKSVQISPIGEPIVVLEENGVEVKKNLGSRTAALR